MEVLILSPRTILSLIYRNGLAAWQSVESCIYHLLTSRPAVSIQKRLAEVDNAAWRWETEPLPPSDKVCVFVTYSPEGHIPQRAVKHAEIWQAAGFQVLFVIALDDYSARPIVPFGYAISRENLGHDFAAWCRALNEIDLSRAELVATVNDSVYASPALAEAIRRAEARQGDVIGFTESSQIRWHVQSYAVLFRSSCVASKAFAEFWSPRAGNRRHVIWTYELQLGREMRRAGFHVATLFPVNATGNPIIRCWSELLAQGFPYLKRNLLQARRAEWMDLAERHGFDTAVINADCPP